MLNEVTLPYIEQFYSTLKGENITEKEYAKCCGNVEIIGEYNDLYLKINCISDENSCPQHYNGSKVNKK